MRSHVVVSVPLAVWLVVSPVHAQQSTPPPPAPQALAVQSAPQAAAAPQDQADLAEGYAWADTCKSCHGAIHDAWAKSKHAKTIERLGEADRQKDCIGCHVTGPKAAVVADGKTVNASVQCESCHGAGKAHAEAAKTGTHVKMVRKPDQKLCETCHSARSPHYRGFFYGALVGLVHKTK
jgi:hypothetical protein